MRTLEDLDLSRPLYLSPYQYDLDASIIVVPVDSLEPIILEGDDVEAFLHWAKIDYWRPRFEEDLQSVAQDSEGHKLLTTWIPLVTFREVFCSGGRHLQEEKTQILMDRLREQTKGWRALEVDTVDVSGYVI